MNFSFVIPCYGSEQTIDQVVEEIQHTIQITDSYEIVLVNDCSPNNVYSVIKDLCSKFSNIIGINLASNIGKHNAIMAGLRQAQGEIICILDDDGQCPMDHFYELILPLNEGQHVSYAYYGYKKQSLFKNFGSFINNITVSILINKPLNLQLTNFVVMKSFIKNEIIRFISPYTYIDGIILRSTKKIVCVPMQDRHRFNGKTTFTLTKMFQLWLNGLTSFSIIPLRITTILGILFSIVGFCTMIYIIINKIINSELINEGWTSVIATILLIGGLNLFTLGMLGEYVGRIFLTLNKTPQYVIEETLNIK